MTLAIIFDSVGAGEWLVLLAVLLVVMGPKRLPSAARQFGSYYSKFRRAAENFRRQLMEMDTELEREVNSMAVEQGAVHINTAPEPASTSAQPADEMKPEPETDHPDAD